MVRGDRSERHPFSLRFISKEKEEGYLQFCKPQMLDSARLLGIGFGVAYVIAMAIRLFTYKPWSETNEELRVLGWTYNTLWSSGVCGVFVLQGLPCFAKCLSLVRLELLGMCAVIASLVPSVLTAQHFMASAYGFELQEDGCVLESFPIVGLFLFVSASHMVFAVRWCVMLPVEVLSFVLYAGVSFTFGLHTRVSLYHSSALLVFVVLMSLGKRRLELSERRFFMTIASERTLRAQAEFQLANFSTSTHHQSAPSMASMATEMSKPLDTIQEIGIREQWLLQEEELEASDRILGEGKYGVVMCGKFHGSPVAIKVTKVQRDQNLANVGQELRIHRRLRHPNIVLFHGACVDEVSQDVALVLEYCVGVSLAEFVDSLTLGESDGARWQCLTGVCRALCYLHTRLPCIVHGDLKASNVQVESRTLAHGGTSVRARLLDFGLSRVLTRNPRPLGGTIRWAAPEVFEGDVPTLPASDVYSFGLMIFFTLTGTPPYAQHNRASVARMVIRNVLPPLDWPVSSPFTVTCKPVVDAMTVSDPSKRRVMKDVHKDLQDLMPDSARTDEDVIACIDDRFWPGVKHALQNHQRQEVQRSVQKTNRPRINMSL